MGRPRAATAIALALATAAGCGRALAPELDVAAGSDDLGDDLALVGVRATAAETTPATAYITISEPRAADGVVEAVPANSAGSLVVADDASCAASTDAQGHARFWPALDGSREPVVVALRRPSALAISRGRDDDSGDPATAIAALDGMGQLEVVRLAPTGAELERASVDAPRPFVELVATARGFVARRDDEVLVWIDRHGASRGELAVRPGERVTELAARRDHAIAIVERGAQRFGRWLAVGPDELAWGDDTKRLPSDAEHVALSPSGARLLVGTPDGQVAVYDVADGHGGRGGRGGRASRLYVAPLPDRQTLEPVGFVDDQTAIVRGDREEWSWPLGGALMSVTAGGGSIAATGVATDRGYIELSSGALAIVNGDGATWLGYRLGAVADLVPARDGGWLASDGAAIVHLDRRLRADRSYLLEAPAGVQRTRIDLIDDRYAIYSDDDKHYVYDLDHAGAEPVELPREGADFQFERASGLAAVSGARDAEVLWWDATAHVFRGPQVTRTHASAGQWKLALVDPNIAHGVVAYDIASDGVVFGDRKVDVERTPLRAGRDGAVEVGATKSIVADVDMVPVPDVAMPKLAQARATSPDGMWVAEIADERLTLRGRRGGDVVWSRLANGASGVAWTAGGELVVYGGGIAKVNALDGAYGERRCGWRFGVMDAAPELDSRADICEAPATAEAEGD